MSAERLLSEEYVPVWHGEADVLVVGFGMAGACAAIGACEAGAEVLVLERSSGGTGTTAAAGGHFYLGGGTPVQTACGFDDSPENMYAYLSAVTPSPIPEKIRVYCEGSVAHFHWLEACGVPFERSYYPFKSVIQPGPECLIWTGNEKVWPYREHARPAPRGHKVAFDGEEGGGALALLRLSAHAVTLGTRVCLDTAVTALVRDVAGRIAGVVARHLGETRYFRARRGVILAAGGFGQNAEMVASYVPTLARAFIQGSPYDDGGAIQLGEAAGGALQHMDQAFMTCPFYPPEDLLKGILVNQQGERFVAEDSYHSRTGILSTEQPEGVVYLIVDEEIFHYPRFAEMMNQMLVDGFDSIEDMEARLGIPAGRLQQTLDQYNQHALRGEDPVFHKYPDWIKPLAKGPWAVFDLSLGRAVYTGFTLGGLSTSVDGEVLTAEGKPIPGLYAAGACASNIAQDSRGYASGTCLGEASLFGRRAGRHAAA